MLFLLLLQITTMRLFLTFLVKSFSAKLAHERLVPRVDARVRVEGGAAVEGLPALITLVRFFLEKKTQEADRC